METHFSVRCWTGRYSNRWVVVRLRDGRVMTEGDVKTCLRWIKTWGAERA